MKRINLTLGNRIFLAFSTTILLMVIAVSISISSIQDIIRNSDEISIENSYKTEILERRIDHLKWVNKLKELITDPEVHALHIETNDHQCAFGHWYYGGDREVIEEDFPELKKYFEEIKEPHFRLHQSAIEIQKKYSTGSMKELLDIFHSKTEKEIEHVDRLFIEIQKTYDIGIKKREATIKADRKKAIVLVILVCLIAAIFSFSFALFIAKSIAKRFKNLLKVAEMISNGNLTAKLKHEANKKDEITSLNNAFSKMLSKLQETVVSVIMGADNVVTASTQISSTSQLLSQGASEQASTAEEISSTIEEINSNIEQNSLNTESSEKLSKEVDTKIHDIKNRLQDVLEANQHISNKINKISEIAFKTNILAINAAIEAARAGENGSGFGAVASEVKSLAELSEKVAKEIISLTEKGLLLSQECTTYLEEILPEVKKSTNKIQEISTSSKEQSIGVNQVNEAMQQLNNITQQNAASSEELASSSEELNSQAEELKQLISFFKLNTN